MKTKIVKKTKKKEPVLELERVEIEVPKGDDSKHLYQVTLVVLADATGDPNRVVSHMMSACLRYKNSIPVVDGFGAKIKNLTLTKKGNRGLMNSSVTCVGFENKPVGKMEKVPVIRVKR